MSNFGNRPAFPEGVLYDPINDRGVQTAGSYYDVGGLSIAQHVYLTLYAASVTAGAIHGLTHNALDFEVKRVLPHVLKSMEDLHK